MSDAPLAEQYLPLLVKNELKLTGIAGSATQSLIRLTLVGVVCTMRTRFIGVIHCTLAYLIIGIQILFVSRTCRR